MSGLVFLLENLDVLYQREDTFNEFLNLIDIRHSGIYSRAPWYYWWYKNEQMLSFQWTTPSLPHSLRTEVQECAHGCTCRTRNSSLKPWISSQINQMFYQTFPFPMSRIIAIRRSLFAYYRLHKGKYIIFTFAGTRFLQRNIHIHWPQPPLILLRICLSCCAVYHQLV